MPRIPQPHIPLNPIAMAPTIEQLRLDAGDRMGYKGLGIRGAFWRGKKSGGHKAAAKTLERVTGLEPADTSLGSSGLTTWRPPLV